MKLPMLVLLLAGTFFGACSSEPVAPVTEPVTGVAPPAAYPSDVPDAIEGANTKVQEITVDGFTVQKLECKGAGGVFASMAIVGKMAEHEEAYTKCAAASEAVQVHFAQQGGKVSDIRVAGASTPDVAKCVGDAVAATAFPGDFTCVVSFEVGPPEAARP